MPQPSKTDDAKRRKAITVALTEDDYNRIHAAARADQRSMADWLRVTARAALSAASAHD